MGRQVHTCRVDPHAGQRRCCGDCGGAQGVVRPALKRRRGHRTRISTFFGLQPRTHLQSRRTGSCAAFAGVLLEQLLLRDPSDLLPEVCWQLDSCDRLLVMALLCSDNKSYVLQVTPFGRGRGRCPPSAVKFPPVTDLKAVLTSPALAGAHPLDPRSCPVVGSLLGPGIVGSRHSNTTPVHGTLFSGVLVHIQSSAAWRLLVLLVVGLGLVLQPCLNCRKDGSYCSSSIPHSSSLLKLALLSCPGAYCSW